jgi:hypothetical protein
MAGPGHRVGEDQSAQDPKRIEGEQSDQETQKGASGSREMEAAAFRIPMSPQVVGPKIPEVSSFPHHPGNLVPIGIK